MLVRLKMRMYALIVISFIANAILPIAHSTEIDCKKILSTENNCNSNDVVAIPLPNEIKDFNFIVKTLTATSKKLTSLKEEYINIARYITPVTSTTYDPRPAKPPKYDKLLSSAEALKNLYAYSNELKKKLDVAFQQHLSSDWRFDIEKEQKVIDELINLHLIQNPILASKASTEYLNNSDKTFDEKSFQKALHSDFVDFFNDTSEFSTMVEKINYLTQEPEKKNSKPFMYLLLEKYPIIAHVNDSYAKNANITESEKQSYCRIQQRYSQINNLKTGAEIGFNALLLLVGVEPIFGAGFLRGRSFAQTFYANRAGIAKAALGLEALSGGRNLASINYINQQCRHLNALRVTSNEGLNEYQQCIDKASNAKIQSMIQAGGIALAGASPNLVKLFEKLNEIRNRGNLVVKSEAMSVDDIVDYMNKNPLSSLEKNSSVGYQFNTPEGRTFSVFDLSKPKISPELKGVQENYLQRVQREYANKLNLSPQEINEFMDESRELSKRTKLYVASHGNPQEVDNIRGGIALVDSKSPEDLLPLEMATGIRVPRYNGRVVEIGRLINVDESDRKLAKEIFNVSLKTELKTTNYARCYAITSTRHLAYYRRYFNFNETPHTNGRDWILDGDCKNLFKK